LDLGDCGENVGASVGEKKVEKGKNFTLILSGAKILL
jgi:hypothetical protein